MLRFRRSGSLSRFFVEGARADVADLSLIKSLERERFKPLEGATEEDSTGWVTRGDASGARFHPEDLIHDHFLVFAMRVDRKRVSPALLKIQISADLRAAAAAGAGKEGREMKRTQKKQIIDEARRKLLARALPTVALTDVVWNCKRNELLIFATGASTVETAANLFRETFKRDLIPATISKVSERYKWDEGRKRALREISPAEVAPGGRAGVPEEHDTATVAVEE